MKLEVRFTSTAYAILPKDQEFVVDIWEQKRDESGAICSLGLEISTRLILVKEEDLPVRRFDTNQDSLACVVYSGEHYRARGEVDHDGSSTAEFLGMQEGT